MASVALSIALFAGVAAAQSSTVNFAPTPLINVKYPRPSDAPYQVFDFNGHDIYTRGYQSGYNICNSTTEGQDSSARPLTNVYSSPDFCLWAPTKLSEIGDAEGDVVAWCTKKGHGTRIIPEGTIKGMQLLFDGEAYMMTGSIDQTKLNIVAGDFGGELDSGGQDGRGNPIGGLLYSTTFSPDGQLFQTRHWTEFIGSNQFCFKWCKDDGPNAAGKCQHTLDRIGLAYNCPSKYTVGAGQADGEFEVCDSDSFPIPGVYTDAAGATQSYAQPPESQGAITSIPYDPTAAATRACTTFASAALFTDAVAAPSSGTSAGTTTGAPSTKTNGVSTTKSSSGSNPTSSSSSKTNGTSSASGAIPAADALPMSLFATVIGVLSAIAMFA
ncbi:uncharacterized protein BXZ73DRAFT_93504 [Epithele typhae]|uniref:uncharacterized protein n=1 Tax=Epithele typhae TaxID=378194 RepID=UPI0020079B04|nr:uncharacterized protein BXZ73DRAFT_93504 [Epithele typhae]KAH9910968.1 hypothetical protein BXZ73DRAFT_93504 [Epithele typhae]